jgi:hypothetical protein
MNNIPYVLKVGKYILSHCKARMGLRHLTSKRKWPGETHHPAATAVG